MKQISNTFVQVKIEQKFKLRLGSISENNIEIKPSFDPIFAKAKIVQQMKPDSDLFLLKHKLFSL